MAVRLFRKLMLIVTIGLSGTAVFPCSAQDQLDDLRSLVEQQGRQIEQLQQQLQSTTYPIAAPGDATLPAVPLPDDGFVDVGKDLSMTGVWKNGLNMETKDKAFRIHPVGRLQVDGVWIDGEDNVEFGPNGVGDTLDAAAFRRMRVGVEGTFWEVCNFHFEPDFANTVNALAPNGSTQTITVPVPIDNWVEVTQLPWLGNVRVGNIKPEYDFEHLTSSNNLDFMERSLLFDAYIGGLDNGFQPGFDIHNTYADQRIRFANSFTKNNQSVFGFNTGEGEYNWTTRLTALPVYEHEGRCLVHVGCSYSHKDLDQDSYRFRARTTLRNGPSALQTTLADLTLAGDSLDMILPELVIINGPLSVIAEYTGVWTNDVTSAARAFGLGTTAIPSSTVYYDGFQVNAMYFLTGENRPYNRRMHTFDRPVPYENFFRVRGEDGIIASGKGAWQVGARYSQVNFNDAGTNGGIVRDVTLGLNWYLNPNLKFQFDTIINEREIPGIASNGYVYGFGTRMALQF